MLPEHPVHRFLLKVLIWLPLVFFAWFYAATMLTWPVTWMTQWVMSGVIPELIESVQQHGHKIEVLTAVAPSADLDIQVPPGKEAVISVELNPLIYGYSLPLFTALLLAAPGGEGQKWLRFFVGMAILLPLQAWGVSFEVFKVLAFDLGQAEPRGWGQGIRDFIALGYQFGYLILPAGAPVVIWIGQNQAFIRQLAPQLDSGSGKG